MRAHKRAKRMLKEAEEKLPLNTPVTDPKVTPLLGDKVTRRNAWNALLGKERANTLIDSSIKFRKKHPEYFKEVFHGGNIDRPIKAKIGDNKYFKKIYRQALPYNKELADSLAKKEYGVYFTPRLINKKRQPEEILVKDHTTLRVLLHELLHLDTSGTRPQEWNNVFDLQKKGDIYPIQKLTRELQYSDINNPTAKYTKLITDQIYPTEYLNQKHEIGSQIGTIRAHLEQQGIDTTNPKDIRKALYNLDKYIKGNDEVKRLHDVIQPTIRRNVFENIQNKYNEFFKKYSKPNTKNNYIESIIKIMQGITQRKPNSNNYPV